MATSTTSFIASIGVNTHLDYLGSVYSNLSVVESALAYLGVSNVRDLAPTSAAESEYASLAAAGMKFDLIISNAGTAVNVTTDLAPIETLEAADPGSVRSIEGPNEANVAGNDVTFDGESASNPSVGDAIMQALYAAMQDTPSLAGVSLINLSVSEGIANWATYDAGLGNESAYINDTNAHVYFSDGLEPAAQILYELSHVETAAPGDPVVITETGYSTSPGSTDGWGGVDQITQAKETLNDLMDAYKDGVGTTYLYELLDEAADPSNSDFADNFGLFLANGTPKLAATAIHDLTTILADNGAGAASFVAGSLDYTLTGLPADGNSMLLEKSDGAFDIVVWAEPDIWNPVTNTDIAAPITPVTVSLGGTYAVVEVFDPLVGTAPVAVYYNVSSVTIDLKDHPLIIEIEPPTITTGTQGTTVPLGAADEVVNSMGPDTITMGSGNATVVADGPTVDIQGGTGALTYSGTATATIVGGSGPMLLTLDGSGSTIEGGTGGMTVTDEVGGNTITGAPGDANNGITVTTTTGNDVITTGESTATNIINLGSGDDTVIANGTSVITGSTGDDTITVNEYSATVSTSTGSSTVTFNTGGEVTTHGTDTVVSTAGVLTVDALGPTINLTGGSGYIWYSGTGAATVTGGSGGGNFDFSQAASDTLITAAGATDTVWLGAGPSTITSHGHDTIYVGSGAATVAALGSTITVMGGSGALTYSGTAQATIDGGSGAMLLTLDGSGSTINGGSGAMTVTDEVGGNTIEGGYGGGPMTVTTTTGDDEIITGDWTATNIINLGSGNDTVIANGTSVITGSTGDDTITVNEYSATVSTSTGSSTVTFNTGGEVTTHGTDTVVSTAGVLTIDALGSTIHVTGGSGYIWFSGTSVATITGGIGGGNFNLAQGSGDALTTALGATDNIELGSGPATITSYGNDTIYAGMGALTVASLGHSIDIQADGGAITYSGTAGATINGNTFALLLTLKGSGVTVNGGSGGMTVLDKKGGNVIQGAYGGSPMTVTTTTGNDEIITGDWTSTNVINLGSGNDTVIANGTSDVTGSTGNDTITVNGWISYVTTSTGTSKVTFNTEGVLTTHGHDTVVSTAGVLTVDAMGPTIHLTGGSGYIWFSGTGVATIAGGIGGGNFDFTKGASGTLTTAQGATDNIDLGAKAVTITSHGDDTIYAGSAATTITDAGLSSSTMTFYGSTGAATLIAGAETFTASGGKGALTVELGSGNDSITIDSAGAANVFKFISGMGGGTDTITGFRAAKDVVDYTGVSVTSHSLNAAGLHVVLSDGTHVLYAGIKTALAAILT